MSYVIQCECGQQMTVEDQHAGQSAMCVQCRRTIQIPAKPLVAGDVVPVQSGLPPAASGVRAPVSAPPQAPPGQEGGGGGWFKPHRGALVLTLGILALVCCCCGGFLIGLPALILGINDMNEMKAGKMDPSGYSMTMAGTVCGGIALALTLFGGLGRLTGFMGRGPWNHGGFRWPL